MPIERAGCVTIYFISLLAECSNGYPSLISLMVYVEVNHHVYLLAATASELRSCVKVEVDVLGSLSLIVFMTAVDVKQH